MNLGLTSLGLRFKFGPITAPGGWRRWRGSSWGYWRAGGGRDRGVAESLEVWYSKWRAYLLKEKWQWDLQQAKHNMQWNHFWRILHLYDFICIYSRYAFCCYIYILCLLAQTAITHVASICTYLYLQDMTILWLCRHETVHWKNDPSLVKCKKISVDGCHSIRFTPFSLPFYCRWKKPEIRNLNTFDLRTPKIPALS